MERQEQSEMGLVEDSEVRNVIQLEDGPHFVLHERAVLRKYEGEVGDMSPEEAEEALFEAIVIEDGVITERWQKGDTRDAPED